MKKVLDCICIEDGKEITRSVYFLELNQRNIVKFWERAKNFHTLFNKELMNNPQQFINSFISYSPSGDINMNCLLFVVDDFVGVFRIDNIVHEIVNKQQVPFDALVHYTFFDKRLRGREPLLKKMIHWLFVEYGFHRLSAEIPTYVKTLNGKPLANVIASELGFVYEGKKREATLFNGKPFHVNLFSLLKSEALRWEAQK